MVICMRSNSFQKWAEMLAERTDDGLLQVRRSTLRGMGSVREANENDFLRTVMIKATRRNPALETILITMPDGGSWRLDVRSDAVMPDCD